VSVGVAVLGSTGSIGTSALKVIARHKDRFHVAALTAFGQKDLLQQQARTWQAPFVGLVKESANGWGTARAAWSKPRRAPTRRSW